ncbi:MAG: acetylxylan esterase [Verrucomicrobia bacterium]|nr:acetylxylan esterase [Verrucomicrobiota bacterium]
MKQLPLFASLALLLASSAVAASAPPAMRFHATSPAEARVWQQAAREKLFALMMGGQQPSRCPLDAKVLRRIEVPTDGYVLEELTLQSLPDRRAHVWLARPAQPKGKVGTVLAINGHGGNGEQIVRGSSLYWYGRAMIEMGYVVIAPDVGQHELQHTNWSLMGERTWDALRSLDHVVTLPEVDPERLAVAGLSLGGETTMYVAALDERLKAACSSGWLTTVANMKNGHCPCFNFAGLEENFDFSDIFACVAPRTLVCELGELERAPGGFPVAIGRQALDGIRAAYRVFNAESNVTLTVHPGPHVFNGQDFFPRLRVTLGENRRPIPDDAATVAWVRFTDGPESLDGTPYYWLGRTELKLTFDVRPQPGDALELGWGGKSDHRDAVLLINGQSVTVRDGGHWGFRWLRVPVPDGIKGERYEIEIKRGQAQPAFFSEVRLTRASGDKSRPDLKQPSFKGKLALTPLTAAAPVEAFPEMRKVWDRPLTLALSPSEGERVPGGRVRGKAGDERVAALFLQAEKNARLANEALFRCRRFVDGWLAQADPASGLIPRNLTAGRDFWNGRDSAADNYPFMVLTAALTDRPLLEGRMRDMLRTETRLTCRLDRLPDDYSFSKKGWRREKLDLDAVIFDGAEYVKDGLLPITEWMGPSPWSERMIGIIDDIWKHAPIDTPFGKLPTLNFEVCGDLLQANARLFWFTGDRKYLDWAVRLGDYFLLGTNHPTRDLHQLRLIDHGCEVVNGLTELYVAVSRARPEKKRAYQKPMHEMFDSILAEGRNPDGLLYSYFYPKQRIHSTGLCDTWGYDLDGFYAMWLIDGTAAYRDAVRQALGHLKGKYVGACWDDKSADGFADSIEGAINLFNREPVESAADWIDSQTRLMWAIQKPDGVIEGWHGDGNFARTSLMYALWKTQGATVQPWRADVRFGAVREGGGVNLILIADQPWEGRLLFDRPRHKLHMRLPLDYTRINQFPEWFTVEADARYDVKLGREQTLDKTGADLADGIPLKLQAGEALALEVRKR